MINLLYYFRRHGLFYIFLLSFFFGIAEAQDIGFSVIDSSGKLVGRLFEKNKLLMNFDGNPVLVRINRAGFDSQSTGKYPVEFYFDSPDCTGDPYYSDQSDDQWVRNDSPSADDLPVEGIFIGVTPSLISSQDFASGEVYVPTLPLLSKTYNSHRRMGVSYKPGPCITSSDTGKFVMLTKHNTEKFNPPFLIIK